MRRRSRRSLSILLAVLALNGLHASRSEQGPGEEATRIKAAFVYNFLKYTEWPASSHGRDAAFLFDVVGRDGMAAALRSVIDGKSVAGRPIRFRVFENAAHLSAESSPGHAVFVEASAQSEWSAIRQGLAGRPTLTIGDRAGFCAAGGMLNLYEKDNRVRFEVNPEAVKSQGLKLSAELLRLAVIVNTEGAP